MVQRRAAWRVRVDRDYRRRRIRLVAERARRCPAHRLGQRGHQPHRSVRAAGLCAAAGAQRSSPSGLLAVRGVHGADRRCFTSADAGVPSAAARRSRRGGQCRSTGTDRRDQRRPGDPAVRDRPRDARRRDQHDAAGAGDSGELRFQCRRVTERRAQGAARHDRHVRCQRRRRADRESGRVRDPQAADPDVHVFPVRAVSRGCGLLPPAGHREQRGRAGTCRDRLCLGPDVECGGRRHHGVCG